MEILQKENPDEFPMYKGLQRPLVFKGFKGKFIGYAAAVLLGSFVLAVLFGIFSSAVTGLIVALFIAVPGIVIILRKQDTEGLYSKNKERAIYKIKGRVMETGKTNLNKKESL